MSDEFSQYQVAQWKASPEATRYAFPVISIDEDGGNRVIERERAYRHGCKLDDTGCKAKRWTLEAIFENSIQEPGESAVNGGLVLYPFVINALIESFEKFHDQAGDLYVPTRGWVRARLVDYRRRESPDEQNCARLTMVFCEDNEDKVDANAFSMPSINANAKRLSSVTTFDSQSDGIWGNDSQSLEEFTAGLESWANAPEDSMQEVDQQASSVIGSVDRIFVAFSKPARQSDSTGRNILRDPESSQTVQKLHSTKEIAARGRHGAERGQPRLVTVVFERPQSLVSIAALLGQSLEDLLAANTQLDDPLYIPPRTPVKIYEQVA
jgi:hypothetical protein